MRPDQTCRVQVYTGRARARIGRMLARLDRRTGCVIANDPPELQPGEAGLQATSRFLVQSWIGGVYVCAGRRGRGNGTAGLGVWLDKIREARVITFAFPPLSWQIE